MMMNEIKRNGYTRQSPIQIGRIGADVERFATSNGIDLGTRQIYLSSKAISHIFREAKGILRIKPKDLLDFPTTKNKMHKYYDGEAFVFTDYKVKFIIKHGYTLKLRSGKKKSGKSCDSRKSNRQE